MNRSYKPSGPRKQSRFSIIGLQKSYTRRPLLTAAFIIFILLLCSTLAFATVNKFSTDNVQDTGNEINIPNDSTNNLQTELSLEDDSIPIAAQDTSEKIDSTEPVKTVSPSNLQAPAATPPSNPVNNQPPQPTAPVVKPYYDAALPPNQ